jgi:putative transposase
MITMPRRPRIAVAGVPLHVIQRGNNRQACFYNTDDYRRYLKWLGEYARESSCAIHAYVLMGNHVHLLLTPAGADSAAQLMKRLGQRYVQYINRQYQRSGTLWEGRYRSCIAQDDGYVLACYRYIELNPVRAGMVRHPADYPWSSHTANSQGGGMFPLTPHPQYLALAMDDDGRRAAYRGLVRQRMSPHMVDEIRQATNGNFALGNDRFKGEVEAALGRRVQPGRPGRPRKK